MTTKKTTSRASAEHSHVPFDFDAAFAAKPVILAPMEELTCATFRRICRARGADICVTEFALADALVEQDATALRKIALTADDTPTAIQIYGANPARLAEAAGIAAAQRPAFIDVNCGCWVPKVARGGAGAGWLRDPDAMVAMASMVVRSVSLPVTVKTRIGWGDEAELPITTLAQKLEAVGVRAITLHCRTARMGHDGAADWSWARRVREVVNIPVIVNGDVRTANDCQRALESTGCAGVMIGRRALEHPFVFREARARLDHAPKPAAASVTERIALCREHLLLLEAEHGPARAVRAMGQWFPRYLGRLPATPEWLRELRSCPDVAALLETLDSLERNVSEAEVADTTAMLPACRRDRMSDGVY